MSSPTAAAALAETFMIVFYRMSGADGVLATHDKLHTVFNNLQIKRTFRLSLTCIFVAIIFLP